jgi:hypothetical protein
MVPHSWHCHIRQSANILGDCCVHRRREWGTMAAAVGQLGHDVSTDVVGLLWVVFYVGIRRVTYHGLPDKATMSIPSSIRAVGLAASLPNRLLCCVLREGTSWGKDAWCRWRWNRRKKSGRRQFLQHAQLISIKDGGRRHPMAAMGPHSLAFKHKTINKHTMEEFYIIKTRKNYH